MSKNINTTLAIKALDNAYKLEQPSQGLILHRIFYSVLKKEEVNLVKYFDFDTARLAIFEYIESWYNRERIHSSLGYITP